MKSVRYFCQILTKIGMFREVLVQFPNIRFRENPFSRSRGVS
jgi:hypothetical protein